MNVFILSDHDFQGGAAIAACRIEASIDRANQHYHQGDGLHDDTQRVVFFSDGKVTPLAELWYDESETKRQFLRLPRKLLPMFFPAPWQAVAR